MPEFSGMTLRCGGYDLCPPLHGFLGGDLNMIPLLTHCVTWPRLRNVAAVLMFFFIVGGASVAAASEGCDPDHPTDWACVCEEVRSYQAYGSDDMVASCREAQDARPCPRCEASCPQRWIDWVGCRREGNSQAACAELRVAAMACEACVEGQVALDGADQVLFVMDENKCASGNESGDVKNPFCSIGDALDVAIQAQSDPSPRGSKVVVCPGVYREEYSPFMIPLAAPGAPPVILESVVQHEAVMTGTDDWRTGWKADSSPPSLAFENLLPFSEDYGVTSGWATTHAMTSVIDAGPFGPPVTATEFQPGASDTVFLTYADAWSEGRYVFSIFVHPYGTTSFGVDLVSDVPGRRPTYSVTLPPAPCTSGPHESADGFGYEALDGGWFRIWVAGDLLGTEANAVTAAHAKLNQVRLWFSAESTRPTEHAGVAVWGAQLESYPLGTYYQEPNRYVPTSGTTGTGYKPSVPIFQRSGWTEDWGLEDWHAAWGCPAAPPLMRRSEQMFLAGQPLRPVLSKDEMVPGTFFLDDGLAYADHTQRWPANGQCPSPGLFANVPGLGGGCSETTPCMLYVAPASEQPVWSSVDQSYGFSSLEVSTRRKVLRVDGTRNWTVRGMTIHGAAGEGVQGGAAVFLAVRDFSFTDNRVIHNSGTGFGVNGFVAHHEQNGDPNHTVKGEREYSTGTYVARNESSDNGILGASLFNHQGVLVEDEVYRRNNWRGHAVQHNSGFVGGCKFGWIDKGLFQGMTLEDNYGNGLWYDLYGVEVDIVDLVATGNRGSGVFLEGAPNLIPSGYGGFSAFPNLVPTHTFRIKNAHVAHNYRGIVASDTPLVEVQNSFIGHNHDPGGNGAQVIWLWAHRDEADTPEGLPNGLHHWTLKSNTYASCASNDFYVYADTQRTAETAEEAVTSFMDTLVSDNNVFLADPTLLNETGFETCPASVQGCPLPGPVPTPGPMTGPFSLGPWRNYTLGHFGLERDRCSSPSPAPSCP